MSFILNALQKSEQERQNSQVETLENSILESKQEARQKKPSIWLIILVICNIFFLIYVISPIPKPEVEKVTTVKKPVPIAKVEDKLALIVEEKIEKPEAVQPEKIEVINKPAIKSIAEQLKPKSVKIDKVVEEVTPLSDVKQILEVEEKIEEQVYLPELLPVVSENIDNKLTTEVKVKNRKIPYLSELSYEFRSSVPEFKINVYVYSEKEQDRFIMINMRKYQTGQEINNGMILKEIAMNSMVFEYKNQIFQINRK